MSTAKTGSRILIYSHDTFGLGHLRRCRRIAHSLVENFSNLSVLIISGSPIIGSFNFRARVDFIRIPGVIKLRNGEYTSLNLHLKLDETLRLRQSIITHTADIFAPDMFIVDKEPLGLRGEIAPALEMLKARGGARLVLGLRDVLDEPVALAAEWRRKQAMPSLQNLYDEIWIYGLPEIHAPLACLNAPPSVERKITYTGYLCAPAPSSPANMHWPPICANPYILVTTGGGGDGEGLIDWVLSAYEHCQQNDAPPPMPALLVLGPFMDPVAQTAFLLRAAALDQVEAITFETHIEQLMDRASAVVAMGGYNIFCEILAADKPALIVPRSIPRLEQTIRARRAHDLGLVSILHDPMDIENAGVTARDPDIMLNALHDLVRQLPPSRVNVPGLYDGLANVAKLTAPWLRQKSLRAIRPPEILQT